MMVSSSSQKRPARKKRTRDGSMSLREHLKELRNRVIKSGLALAVGTAVGFFFYRPAFTALTDPVTRLSTDEHPAEVIMNSVGQPFDIMLQVALFIGIVLSSPIWLYQLWAYVVPGLKKHEKRYALIFIGISVPLFIGGIVLGWIALPQALQFFVGLTPEGVPNRIFATVYIPFVLRLLLAFGVALILPVVLVGLNMMGVIKGRQLLQHWRITVFLIAVLAAMAAPGSDVLTMFYLGGPLALLFAVAIGIALLNDRRRAKKADQQNTDDQPVPTEPARPLNEL